MRLSHAPRIPEGLSNDPPSGSAPTAYPALSGMDRGTRGTAIRLAQHGHESRARNDHLDFWMRIGRAKVPAGLSVVGLADRPCQGSSPTGRLKGRFLIGAIYWLDRDGIEILVSALVSSTSQLEMSGIQSDASQSAMITTMKSNEDATPQA